MKRLLLRGRLLHSVENFNGYLWVIGGSIYSHTDHDGTIIVRYINDVWRSPDGVSWQRISASAPFAPAGTTKGHYATAVFKNALWVIGGENENYDKTSDVWRTYNGFTWQKVTVAPFTGRFTSQSNSIYGNLWITGGITQDFTNDVWNSDDGINWTQVLPAPPFAGRSENPQGNGFEERNDVWRTYNGTDWEQVSVIPFESHSPHTAVVFDDALWLGSGRDNMISFGMTYGKVILDSEFFDYRLGSAATVFNGEVWI
ncbi:hypothetical protein CHS0354_018565 [Potamilus streckersoni]|uniref:Galactose oxidase n=1 Tax=Potamilus streckersoni TaxID=2493646 RepID=A0AAE0TAV1_9BIVA|nr:hypothetical protein CHS0354_018565 [Potamilus streckersoni]